MFQQGYSRERIAAELGVSLSTVKSYEREIRGYIEKEEAERKRKALIDKLTAEEWKKLRKNHPIIFYLVKCRWISLVLGILVSSLSTILFLIGIVLAIIGFVSHPKRKARKKASYF